jgi:hypothetical protein
VRAFISFVEDDRHPFFVKGINANNGINCGQRGMTAKLDMLWRLWTSQRDGKEYIARPRQSAVTPGRRGS